VNISLHFVVKHRHQISENVSFSTENLLVIITGGVLATVLC